MIMRLGFFSKKHSRSSSAEASRPRRFNDPREFGYFGRVDPINDLFSTGELLKGLRTIEKKITELERKLNA